MLQRTINGMLIASLFFSLFLFAPMDARALDPVPPMPLQGAEVNAPPLFRWPAGDYEYYIFYSYFDYSYLGPAGFPLILEQPSLSMPDWWWKYLLDTDHVWMVFGVNTAGGETRDLLVLQSFTKQYSDDGWAALYLRNYSLIQHINGQRFDNTTTLSVDGQQLRAVSGTQSHCIWLKCNRTYDMTLTAVGYNINHHATARKFLECDCLYALTTDGPNGYFSEGCPGGCSGGPPASDPVPAADESLPDDASKGDELPDDVAEAIWAFLMEYFANLEESQPFAEEETAEAAEPAGGENATFNTSDDICFVDALKQ